VCTIWPSYLGKNQVESLVCEMRERSNLDGDPPGSGHVAEQTLETRGWRNRSAGTLFGLRAESYQFLGKRGGWGLSREIYLPNLGDPECVNGMTEKLRAAVEQVKG